MNYRPEVDGLRALAIIPVILFHAGASLFGGGFIGVDVFFVISGYLITTIILAEAEPGRFSAIRFYERRARRILPALFLVCLVSVVVAWFTLLPDDMLGFSKSLVGLSVFSTNILFWKESGYFDVATDLKPMLHTWSLAIEEQYYLVYPAFVIATWKLGRRWMLVLVAVIAVASFTMAQRRAVVNPFYAFYLLPTRLWELAVGCVLGFLLSRDGLPRFSDSMCNAIATLGMALIVIPIFAYSTATPFPGVYALPPTIGTALVICFARPGTTVAQLLSVRPLVLLGLISYSAYLWHQPIFAFARHRSLEEPSAVAFAVLIATTLLLAYLTWRFVEIPARNPARIGQRAVFISSGAGLVTLALVGAAGIHSNGFSHRNLLAHLPADYAAQSQIDRTPSPKVKGVCITATVSRAGYCHANSSPLGRRILLAGDSHSADFLVAFRDFATTNSLDAWQMSVGGCQFLPYEFRANPECRRARATLEALVERTRPDVVVLVFLLDKQFIGKPEKARTDAMDSLAELIRKMTDSGSQVIVFLPRHHFDVDPLRASMLNRQSEIQVSDVEENERMAGLLKAMSSSIPFTTYDPRPPLLKAGCGKVECFNAHTAGNLPLYRDNHHLTTLGENVVFDDFISFMRTNVPKLGLDAESRARDADRSLPSGRTE